MPLDLPIKRIGRISPTILRRLKKHRISTIGQLTALLDGGTSEPELAAMIDSPLPDIVELARRVRLRQINGVGTIFEIMLELSGITDVQALAEQDKVDLYQRLARVNAEERLARRSPTPEEVSDWIDAARAMSRT